MLVGRTIRKVGLPARPQDYQIQAHSGGGKVVVWGCFSAAGVGELLRIDGTMNTAQYVSKVLVDALPNSLRKFRLRPRSAFFVQDNASCHKSQAAMAKLTSLGVFVVDHPPMSPDLNPIENLWDTMKWELSKMPQARSLDKLWEQIKVVWGSITPDQCKNLIDSMPRRLECVKKAKGGATKY